VVSEYLGVYRPGCGLACVTRHCREIGIFPVVINCDQAGKVPNRGAARKTLCVCTCWGGRLAAAKRRNPGSDGSRVPEVARAPDSSASAVSRKPDLAFRRLRCLFSSRLASLSSAQALSAFLAVSSGAGRSVMLGPVRRLAVGTGIFGWRGGVGDYLDHLRAAILQCNVKNVKHMPAPRATDSTAPEATRGATAARGVCDRAVRADQQSSQPAGNGLLSELLFLVGYGVVSLGTATVLAPLASGKQHRLAHHDLTTVDA
jgi:hypothetical protein